MPSKLYNAYWEELNKKRTAQGQGTLHYFPPLQDSKRLSYEILTPNNYIPIFNMFYGDDTPFVDERFKLVATAKKYAQFVANSANSAKNGGCDFLIKLKGTDTYVGILHLFDYSLETFSDIPQRCTFGFAIAKPYRQNGYATEAVRHLINYAHIHHQKTKFIAYTNTQNVLANAFLCSLGMVLSNNDYYDSKENNCYKLSL